MTNYMRQLGFFDPADHPNAHVTVIGLGGIGSFAAVSLAKLGVQQITAIDFDTVEPHNTPNQFYTSDQVGLPKALAIADTCESLSDINVHAVPMSFADALTSDDPYQHTDIIVSGLDSMAARMDIWSSIKYNPRTSLYLDARIAGQLIVIYATNPTNIDHIDNYEATLHSDDDALPAACTERGVIDVGMAVGSLLTRLTRAFYAGDEVPPVTILNLEHLSLTRGDHVPA